MSKQVIDIAIITGAASMGNIHIYNNNEVKNPFMYISSFYKNKVPNSKYSFKQAYNELTSYFNAEKINFGIFILPDGFVILTEKKLKKFDPLVFKLESGFNFNKQFKYDLNTIFKNFFGSDDISRLKTMNIIRE